MNPLQLAQSLGLEYEKKGALVRVVCPFHHDTKPSLVIYPDHCYCYACGTHCTHAHLLKEVKGLNYKEAYKELGIEFRGETIAREYEEFNFCSAPEWVGLAEKRYNACLNLPPVAVSWLKYRGTYDFAVQDGWKWTESGIANWQQGIVIPYRENGKVVTLRFRKLITTVNAIKDHPEALQCPINHETGEHSSSIPETLESALKRQIEHKEIKFDKPISLPRIESRPKLPETISDTVYFCEGEQDFASLQQLGFSAVCIPGCMARKCINTGIKFCALNGVKRIVSCGDNDEPGQKMNEIVRHAVEHLAPEIEFAALPIEAYAGENDINDVCKTSVNVLKDHLQALQHVSKSEMSENPVLKPETLPDLPESEIGHKEAEPTNQFLSLDEIAKMAVPPIYVPAGINLQTINPAELGLTDRFIVLLNDGRRYEIDRSKQLAALKYLEKHHGAIYSFAGIKIMAASEYWFNVMPNQIDPVTMVTNDIDTIS